VPPPGWDPGSGHPRGLVDRSGDDAASHTRAVRHKTRQAKLHTLEMADAARDVRAPLS